MPRVDTLGELPHLPHAVHVVAVRRLGGRNGDADTREEQAARKETRYWRRRTSKLAHSLVDRDDSTETEIAVCTQYMRMIFFIIRSYFVTVLLQHGVTLQLSAWPVLNPR